MQKDPNKVKALEAAIAQIEKNYGQGSIMKLGDTRHMQVESVPTGSLSLDLALGVGGIPKGRIVEIYGPESSVRRRLHFIWWQKCRNRVVSQGSLMRNTHWTRFMQRILE